MIIGKITPSFNFIGNVMLNLFQHLTRSNKDEIPCQARNDTQYIDKKCFLYLIYDTFSIFWYKVSDNHLK